MTQLPPFKSATLTCPVCSGALRVSKDQKTLSCDNKHSYDRAKQGYVNLLLNTAKRSKQPGDTPQMVDARSAFLALGHYQPIVEKLIKLLDEDITAGLKKQSLAPEGSAKAFQYTDIACGEGYYANAISNALSTRGLRTQAKGIDISTPAIKAASRRFKSVHWYVANAFQMPIATNSQDLCTHMFSRLGVTEAARVLKVGSTLIDVQAGPAHLASLKAVLYETPNQKSEIVSEAAMSEFFEAPQTHTLSFEFELNSSEQITNLVDMTPHMWKATKDRIENAKSLPQLALQAEVVVSLYRRNQKPYISSSE